MPHEAVLVLAHELRHLSFLLRSQDLEQLRMYAGFLHDKVSHGLTLLRCHAANLVFVEGPVGFELHQRVVSLFHLLGQGVKRRLFFRKDLFGLRLLRFIKVQVARKESHSVLAEHSVSMHAMHVGPLNGLRHPYRDQQREHKRRDHYLDTIRFH